ncbi:hypothetical protein BJ508DRAFT_325121 [Ascobolus immersus RN42]|uniref:DUF1640-domain-containing protein n=1 Tax=Ascobolus immersus RN42 TaxID=1160509 RepID=A0A3N4IA54_ASCIM|nr:hypothetical protein BJ508DRAFT_325121 [Ascobolus immersus RN42]
METDPNLQSQSSENKLAPNDDFLRPSYFAFSELRNEWDDDIPDRFKPKNAPSRPDVRKVTDNKLQPNVTTKNNTKNPSSSVRPKVLPAIQPIPEKEPVDFRREFDILNAEILSLRGEVLGMREEIGRLNVERDENVKLETEHAEVGKLKSGREEVEVEKVKATKEFIKALEKIALWFMVLVFLWAAGSRHGV